MEFAGWTRPAQTIRRGFRDRADVDRRPAPLYPDRKSTRLNSSHRCISYAFFCLKKQQLLVRRFEITLFPGESITHASTSPASTSSEVPSTLTPSSTGPTTVWFLLFFCFFKSSGAPRVQPYFPSARSPE